MRSNDRNSNKIKALQELRADAPMSNVRRALCALYGYEHAEMGRILGVSRSNITLNINGLRKNRTIQQGICTIWGLPREEVFCDESRRCGIK